MRHSSDGRFKNVLDGVASLLDDLRLAQYLSGYGISIEDMPDHPVKKLLQEGRPNKEDRKRLKFDAAVKESIAKHK